MKHNLNMLLKTFLKTLNQPDSFTLPSQNEIKEAKNEAERREIAYKFYNNYDFGNFNIVDYSKWKIDGNIWEMSVFIDVDEDGPSTHYKFIVEFDANNNIINHSLRI